MAFETLAIHAGQYPDPVPGSVVSPIYATSSYTLLPEDVYGGTFRFFVGVLADPLIEVSAPMTHFSVSDTLVAVPQDLVRLSPGIEAADDLIRGLDQAIRVGS